MAPNPTALPAAASINPILDENCSLEDKNLYSFFYILVHYRLTNVRKQVEEHEKEILFLIV
ncbi:hypothetical protein GCM10007425_22910 [Lysinibacillus alkalisoli]|uniref:Uncharacterized protein n=1 Tax=Lysinibacillus alkalisoli TaxID=1911548 RepID=A0A917LIU6_9BACI|nr:hypothetical protein GCM10007425_22910 [Lysinibacillus alkalisoli]